MKALIFNGPGDKQWTDKEEPKIIKSTDAIVKITHTTICGTDLHILKGDVPEVTAGRVLGHEGVGRIEAVGENVKSFKPGDMVLISCITSCGNCENCKRQLYSHCADGGWILGHLIDGTQAEYVRIPHADNSLYLIPENTTHEESMVMLSDIFPTGFEIGVLAGNVKPGDTLAIIGAGPVGMAALLTAQLYSPACIIMVDNDAYRLKIAKDLGATHIINGKTENVVDCLLKITDQVGVDVAIEAVGVPATFDICQQIIAPGGRIANIGVHGKSVELQIEKLWIRNIVISMGLVNTNTISMLLKIIQAGKLKVDQLITHRFPLNDIIKAYEVFGSAAKEQAIKVVLSA